MEVARMVVVKVMVNGGEGGDIGGDKKKWCLQG